jgi:hyperosmotically inducible protein
VEGAHAKAADDLDAGIQERFETLMENSTDIDGSDVDLRVANGVATITGTVRTDAERTKIEGLVRSIPGVNSVVNTVTVERARDRKPDTRN